MTPVFHRTSRFQPSLQLGAALPELEGGYAPHIDEQMINRFGPAPIITIHVLAFVGVLFWVSSIVQGILAGLPNGWAVVPVGIVLGGAHVAISWLTTRHDRRVIAAMWFVLISDALLAIFVNYLAVVLVLFTIVLLLLTRTSSAKEWFRSRTS